MQEWGDINEEQKRQRRNKRRSLLLQEQNYYEIRRKMARFTRKRESPLGKQLRSILLSDSLIESSHYAGVRAKGQYVIRIPKREVVKVRASRGSTYSCFDAPRVGL